MTTAEPVLGGVIPPSAQATPAVSGVAGWIRFLLLALGPFAAGYFLSYLMRNINSTMGPLIASDIGIGARSLGIATGAFSFGFAIALIAVGVAVDRHGPARVQAVLMTLAGSATVLFACSSDSVWLTVTRLAIGIGYSGALMCALKVVALGCPAPRVPLLNGLVVAVGSLGAAAATMPTDWLLAQMSWRCLLLCIAAATLTCALLHVVLPLRFASPTKAVEATACGYAEILNDRWFRSFAPLSAAVIGSGWAMQGLWAAAWLRDVARMPRARVIEDLLLLALMLAFAALINGMLSSLLRRRGVSHASQLAGVAILVLASEILLAFETSVPPLLPWGIIAISGAATVIGFSANVERFGTSRLGRANTLLTIGHMLGALAVQAGLGFVLDFWSLDGTGAYPAEAYQAGFLVVATVQGLAVVRLALMSRRKSPCRAEMTPTAKSETCGTLPMAAKSERPMTALLPYLVMILSFQAVGEVVARTSELPIPGALLGMLGLLVTLAPRRTLPEELRLVARFLVEHMNLFFIPGAAAIVGVVALLGQDLFAIGAALVVSTVASLAVTGLVASFIARRRTKVPPERMTAVALHGSIDVAVLKPGPTDRPWT